MPRLVEVRWASIRITAIALAYHGASCERKRRRCDHHGCCVGVHAGGISQSASIDMSSEDCHSTVNDVYARTASGVYGTRGRSAGERVRHSLGGTQVGAGGGCATDRVVYPSPKHPKKKGTAGPWNLVEPYSVDCMDR